MEVDPLGILSSRTTVRRWLGEDGPVNEEWRHACERVLAGLLLSGGSPAHGDVRRAVVLLVGDRRAHSLLLVGSGHRRLPATAGGGGHETGGGTVTLARLLAETGRHTASTPLLWVTGNQRRGQAEYGGHTRLAVPSNGFVCPLWIGRSRER